MIKIYGLELRLRDVDNAELLMHFTDLPQADPKAPPKEISDDDKDLSSFALISLLTEESKALLDEQLNMRGDLFEAVLCYALEWICVSYWRMGSYPAAVIAGTASNHWLTYATWCARKNITDPLAGRLVDVLGRMWAWKEEPYLKRLKHAQKPVHVAQAKADLRAQHIELFDREV